MNVTAIAPVPNLAESDEIRKQLKVTRTGRYRHVYVISMDAINRSSPKVFLFQCFFLSLFKGLKKIHFFPVLKIGFSTDTGHC